MKISERKLRRVISNMINEMSDMLPPGGEGLIERMADACCAMNSADIFKMCAQIFAANSNMAKHCAELCACACSGDDRGYIGCCRCLGEICKCSNCAKICKDCCNC